MAPNEDGSQFVLPTPLPPPLPTQLAPLLLFHCSFSSCLFFCCFDLSPHLAFVCWRPLLHYWRRCFLDQSLLIKSIVIIITNIFIAIPFLIIIIAILIIINDIIIHVIIINVIFTILILTMFIIVVRSYDLFSLFPPNDPFIKAWQVTTNTLLMMIMFANSYQNQLHGKFTS